MKNRLRTFTALLFAFAAVNINAQTELFRANEFSVRLAILNPMDIGTQDTFDAKAASLAGFEAGMAYHWLRWMGAEINVPIWKSDNRCFQSVSAGMTFRLPLDMVSTAPIWSHIAPYGRIGLGFGECYTAPWSAYIGGGLEVRINRTFGVFGGVVLSQRGIFESDSFNVVRPEVGMRLSF